MSKTVRIKWSIKHTYILSLDRRTKTDWQGVQTEYAVIKVGTVSDFDDIEEATMPSRVKVKFTTLMCFDENVFSRLQIGESYSFSGKVGFGYGSTFFIIEQAFLFGELITTLDQEDVEREEGDSPPPLESMESVMLMLDDLGYLPIFLTSPSRGMY